MGAGLRRSIVTGVDQVVRRADAATTTKAAPAPSSGSPGTRPGSGKTSPRSRPGGRLCGPTGWPEQTLSHRSGGWGRSSCACDLKNCAIRQIVQARYALSMDEGGSMPIEILIAPAAPSVESAGNFWKYGLPVVSLILGILLKWVLDYAIERRRDAAQRTLRLEQRRDLLKTRRLDAERSNLIAVQAAAVNLLQAGRDLRVARLNAPQPKESWHRALVAPELESEAQRCAAQLLPLSTRLHTPDVAGQVNLFLGEFWKSVGAYSAKESWSLWQGAEAEFAALQRLAGKAIRDLEDERQQLVDAPAQ